MSREATDWAAKQRPAHALDKLVLWALADAHSREKRCAYPSVAAVVEFTGWQRRAVLSSLARLAAAGLIVDTGDRIGQTRQIKVWRFPFDPERVHERNRSAASKGASTSTLSDPERVHEMHTEPSY